MSYNTTYGDSKFEGFSILVNINRGSNGQVGGEMDQRNKYLFSDNSFSAFNSVISLDDAKQRNLV